MDSEHEWDTYDCNFIPYLNTPLPCTDSSHNPGRVYIASGTGDVIKVGATRRTNPAVRLREMGLVGYSITHSIETDRAFLLERGLHFWLKRTARYLGKSELYSVPTWHMDILCSMGSILYELPTWDDDDLHMGSFAPQDLAEMLTHAHEEAWTAQNVVREWERMNRERRGATG